MKPLLAFVVFGSLLAVPAAAQDPSKPVLRTGVSVQMAAAERPAEMREADADDAIVVAVTAAGRIYAGTEAVEAAALGGLRAGPVYVKADARAPYQAVLTVLAALRGRPVGLLTAPPSAAGRTGIVPPYGIRMTVSR
jgi:hypothetical protein